MSIAAGLVAPIVGCHFGPSQQIRIVMSAFLLQERRVLSHFCIEETSISYINIVLSRFRVKAIPAGNVCSITFKEWRRPCMGGPQRMSILHAVEIGCESLPSKEPFFCHYASLPRYTVAANGIRRLKKYVVCALQKNLSWDHIPLCSFQQDGHSTDSTACHAASVESA